MSEATSVAVEQPSTSTANFAVHKLRLPSADALRGQSQSLDEALNRSAYNVLGLPFDAVTMSEAAARVRTAARRRAPLFVSTPNLNFLVASARDEEFRTSVIDSDLCVADGMPIVWIARLLNIPIQERVAGSDLIDALKRASPHDGAAVKVFFLGGPEGAAALASERLNAERCGLECVGSLYPGYCSVEEMSQDAIIDKINSSGADFLVVALGAKKGQAWLMRNADRLEVPIVSHLGAVVNFEAGSLKRAPEIISRNGLEWAWRIKEEPALWRRYFSDGLSLLRLLMFNVVPLMAWTRWTKRRREVESSARIQCHHGAGHVRIVLVGNLSAANLEGVREAFRTAMRAQCDLVLEFGDVIYLDSGFMGLLLLLHKAVRSNGCTLQIAAVSPALRRVFRWHMMDELLG